MLKESLVDKAPSPLKVAVEYGWCNNYEGGTLSCIDPNRLYRLSRKVRCM